MHEPKDWYFDIHSIFKEFLQFESETDDKEQYVFCWSLQDVIIRSFQNFATQKKQWLQPTKLPAFFAFLASHLLYRNTGYKQKLSCGFVQLLNSIV